MLLFSCILLPLLIAGFCFTTKEKRLITVIGLGLLSAIFVAAFQAFFTFAHRIIPYDFVENFLYLAFRQAFLPVIILYGLYLLISRDDTKLKITSFLPLELSFYAIYLPYLTVTTSEGLYSAFALFFKPLLFAAMLLQLSIFINWIYISAKSKKFYFSVLFVILALAWLFLPAVFEAFFLLQLYPLLWIIGGVVYILLPVVLLVLKGLATVRS